MLFSVFKFSTLYFTEKTLDAAKSLFYVSLNIYFFKSFKETHLWGIRHERFGTTVFRIPYGLTVVDQWRFGTDPDPRILTSDLRIRILIRTNNDASGSGRTKNIWILRIRIRTHNTAFQWHHEQTENSVHPSPIPPPQSKGFTYTLWSLHCQRWETLFNLHCIKTYKNFSSQIFCNKNDVLPCRNCSNPHFLTNFLTVLGLLGWGPHFIRGLGVGTGRVLLDTPKLRGGSSIMGVLEQWLAKHPVLSKPPALKKCAIDIIYISFTVTQLLYTSLDLSYIELQYKVCVYSTVWFCTVSYRTCRIWRHTHRPPLVCF